MGRCRSCRATLEELVMDLGHQPVGDALLDADGLETLEPTYPLRLVVCTHCWLVQLAAHEGGPPSVAVVHGHGEAFSPTVLAHLRDWAHEMIERLGLTSAEHIVDVASGGGYLLRPFAERGISVLGVESDPAIAAAAADSGIPTKRAQWGRDVAHSIVENGLRADLMLVNHGLAHANDVDDFIAGLELVLAPGGTIALEFHHVLQVVRRAQFDIVCHPHRSYFSLVALETALARHGLTVVDAEEFALHGGSVRALARRTTESPKVTRRARAVAARERSGALEQLASYRHVEAQAAGVRHDLITFLTNAKASGAFVVAYGAPSRGTTLLNYCCVTTDLVSFTVDRAPHKQGRYLPGCRVPVLAPPAIEAVRPDYVLILPWTLREEIAQQMSVVRSWGGRFVVALPALRVLD